MPVESYTLEDPIEEFRRDLARANRFSPEDFQANVSGQISNRQMFRLGLEATRPLLTALVTLCGWIIFVEVVRLLVPSILQRLLWGKALGSSLIVTIGCFWGVLVGFLQTSRLTVLLLMDVIRGKSACLEGSIYFTCNDAPSRGLDRFHGEKSKSYRYIIRDKEFAVSEAAYQALRSYDSSIRLKARVFYTPRSQMLLSVEPL